MRPDNCIDYVEFPAKDLAAVKAFYAAVFGWRFQDYGPEYCAFSDGRLDGGFFVSDRRARVADGSALIVLYAADLEGTLRQVKAHGGRIVRDIFTFPGGRRFHFSDPADNELAVWSVTEEPA